MIEHELRYGQLVLFKGESNWRDASRDNLYFFFASLGSIGIGNMLHNPYEQHRLLNADTTVAA